MTADLTLPAAEPQVAGEVAEVRSAGDRDAWHAVYREVFGADQTSRSDWQRVYGALGPPGDGSLLLVLARVSGSPAATGAVFFEHEVAGLYCFTTRESMRGRGLASALVHAAHRAARARGVEQALLHATALGEPVYARAGYTARRALPMLKVTRGESRLLKGDRCATPQPDLGLG
jgi:GNAT superfamily N-acetyltransferase